MKIIEECLNGIKLLEPIVYEDQRGFFMECYNQKVMEDLGIPFRPVQDNQSLSESVGTLRGLHFQLPPASQAKLVRVLRGAIYDVVVDIRPLSPTFGQWKGFLLNDSNHFQLFVPKGFAHGFCTLEQQTQVLYKVDHFYSPKHDRGLLWSDPELGISWPEGKKTLSQKDQSHPSFKEYREYLAPESL